MKKTSQLVLVIFLLSVSSLFVSRTIIGHWVDQMWIPLAGMILAPILMLILDFSFFKKSISSYRALLIRRVLKRAILVLSLLLLVGGLVEKLDLSFDLSHSKVNSLSPDSVKALANLKLDVKLTAFFQKTNSPENLQNFRQLMAEIERASPSFTYKIVNAELEPGLVEKFKIVKTPSFVVESGARVGVLNSWNEEKVVNEMTRLQKDKNSIICSLSGNGEIPLKSEDQYRLTAWAETLLSVGFEMRAASELDFIKNSDACDILLSASPKLKYSKLLQQKMEEFVLKGRGLLVAVDPGKDHGLGVFLKRFGIQNYNNYIIDISGEEAGFNAATVIGNTWNTNLLIGDWLQGKAVVFPVASQLGVIEPAIDSFKAEALVFSGAKSFVKSELTSKVEFKPSLDSSGEFPVGILSLSGSSKVLVFSDGDFFTDEYFAFQGNRELALQAISFLSRDTDFLKLAPKTFYKEVFVLTPVKAKIFLILGILPIPFLLLGFSIWIFVRRRLDS